MKLKQTKPTKQAKNRKEKQSQTTKEQNKATAATIEPQKIFFHSSIFPVTQHVFTSPKCL